MAVHQLDLGVAWADLSPLRSADESVDEPSDVSASLGDALAREAPILLAAARAILLDDAEAEDVVATTLEIAVRRARDLRDRSALRAWLLTIQSREAFRLRRRLRRLVRLSGDLPATRSGLAEAGVIDVRTALTRLPPRTRAAIVLHHMIGLSVAEVAEALAVSPNTVKTQLRTGLARLRQELDHD